LVKDLGVENVIQIDNTLGCLFCLKFSPKGNVLAATTADCVQILDHKKPKLLHTLKDHKEIVTALTWFNNTETEDSFFTSSLDKTVSL